MKNRKIWGSAAVDFIITAGTAFLALPQDVPLTLRSVITIIVGAAIATAKGIQTYYATHPEKREEERRDRLGPTC